MRVPVRRERHRAGSRGVPFAAGTLLLLLAASRAEAQAQDGPWSGTTGQARPINFTVLGGGTQVNPLAFGWSTGGCTVTSSILVAIPIVGNSFSYSSGGFGACISYLINGTFTSPTTASGTVNVTTISQIGCPCSAGNLTSPWSAVPPPPSADLALSLTDGQTTAVPGAAIAYTLTVTNGGPNALASLTLADTLPAALTNPSFLPSSGSYSPTSGAWTGLALGPGQSVTLALSATVSPSATGTLVHSATVVSSIADPNPGNDSASDSDTLVPRSDLSVGQTGPANAFTPADLTYVITVTNQGPSDASGVSLANGTPTGLTFVANSGDCLTAFPCSLGGIPAGQSRVVSARFALPANYTGPDPIQNTATVSAATTDPNSANDTAVAFTRVNPPGGRFFTVAPCRLVDTREAAGPLAGPALGANLDRSFVLVGACNLPATAKAVSLNVTVTGASAPGDLRLAPSGIDPPLVSSVNYGIGQTRANNAVLSLGSGGVLVVRCDQLSGTVELILDVNGYFE